MHMLHSSCSKSSAPYLAFASARLMALRRLVAGRALDFEQELCSLQHIDIRINIGIRISIHIRMQALLVIKVQALHKLFVSFCPT